MGKEIKVMYKEVGKEAYPMTIRDELHVYQDLVEGYIEVVRCGHNVLAIVNEEGRLNDSKFNMKINDEYIFGNIVFVGDDGSEDFADIDMENYKKFTESL